MKIENFIKNNPIRFKNNMSKKKVLVVDRMRGDALFIACLAGFIFNKFFKYNVDLVTDTSKYGISYKLHKSYNFNKIYHLSLQMINLNKILLIFFTLCNFIFILFKILLFGDNWFIYKFKLRGIYFGDIFYDDFVRHQKGYIHNSLLNFKFLKILFIGVYKINSVNQILHKDDYKFVVCSTFVYTSTSAITMRIALKNGIKVILFRNIFFQLYNKLSDAYTSDRKVYKKDLKLIDKIDQKWSSKINIYLSNKFAGKSTQRDSKVSFGKDKQYLKSVLKSRKLNLKGFKRVGLFAPHCFTDSNYAQGYFLFKNYYEHFIKTLEIIEKNKNIFWFVKPHPLNQIYNEQDLTREALLKLNKKNTYIYSDKINTLDLLKASDIIVTGRGTIGIEAACLGKKPVLAGDSYYASLGITLNPKNVHEYENLILNDKSNYILNKKQIYLAKKACFSDHFRYSFFTSKIIPKYEFIDVNIKKKIVMQKFIYGKDHLQTINLNLKKHDIFKDRLYLSLKKFILEI